MSEIFKREIALIGESAFNKLSGATVAVFGLGGVGSYVVEALCRAGVGKLVLCDNDVIAPHNINRQLYALNSTIGQKKVEVALKRCLDINPNVKIELKDCFFDSSTLCQFDFSSYDYIADCIDTVTSKILLCETAFNSGVKIISSMGTGNKVNCNFLVSDIYKTQVCPLAKVMRRELKKRNVLKLKCVYSQEEPVKVDGLQTPESTKRVPASISYPPAIAGLTIAGEIIKDLGEL